MVPPVGASEEGNRDENDEEEGHGVKNVGHDERRFVVC